MANEEINILVIGKGGREADMGKGMSESPMGDQVWMAPGNGDSPSYSKTTDVGIDYPHCRKFISFLKEKDIGLVVTGSETDLVKGIADRVRMHGIDCMGMGGGAAEFEGNKAFASDFRDARGIPQPGFEIFDSGDMEKNVEAAKEYGIKRFENGAKGLVPKFAGLAGGKGAIVTRNLQEYMKALKSMPGFVKGGMTSLVVENFEQGVEVSVTVLVQDPSTYKILSYAQDYKPIGEGDIGPNTGGMGAVTLDLSADLSSMIEDQIIRPTIAGAHKIYRPMTGGILYVGLMITPDGKPKVLEYNVRMGDPEGPVIRRRVTSDWAELMYCLARGNLDDATYTTTDAHSALVVMAAKGYPGTYTDSEGALITGIEDARAIPGVTVNIAGTTHKDIWRVEGSRNIHVIGTAATQLEALKKAYQGVAKIESEGLIYRRDIGCNLEKIAELNAK